MFESRTDVTQRVASFRRNRSRVKWTICSRLYAVFWDVRVCKSSWNWDILCPLFAVLLLRSYHLPVFSETRRSERGQGEWSLTTAILHHPPPLYCTRGSLGTETSVTRCNRYSAYNYVLVLTADRDYWQLLTSFSLNTNVIIIIIRILKGSVNTDPSCYGDWCALANREPFC